MFIVDKDDKKTIIPFLSEYQEEIRKYLPFPRLFQFEIHQTLKDYIKKMDQKYENIYQKEDKGVFINDIQEDIDDTSFLSYLHQEDYWKTFPYLDLLYDLFNLQEKYSNEERIYQDVREVIKSGINENINSTSPNRYYKRHKIKPGKFLKKLFPDATAQECEEFQQKWFHIYKQYGWDSILETDEVKKYYHNENYYEMNGPLGASCMRGMEHQIQVQFYQNNHVRLAIYKEPDTDKIRARALIWDVDIPEFEQKKHNLPERMTFMDRIYYLTEKDKLTMVQYAKKMGYIYKENQGAGRQPLILPREGKEEGEEVDSIQMMYPLNEPSGTLPYRDTFIHIVYVADEDKYYITNSEDVLDDPLPHEDYIYDPDKDRYIYGGDVSSCPFCYKLFNANNTEERTYHREKECI